MVAPASRVSVYAMLVLSLTLVLSPGWVRGQPQVPDTAPSQPGGRVLSGQSQTPIGDSGYSVTIPEVRMNKIIGPRPQPEPPPSTKEDEPASKPEDLAPQPEEYSPRQIVPAQEPGRSVSAPSELEESPVAEPTRRLPFEPVDRKPTTGPFGIPLHEQPAAITPQAEDEGKEDQSPFLSAPRAPEDLARDLPPPRKEMLMRKPFPAVPLLEEQLVKPAPRAMPLERQQYRDVADQKESISLDARRAPEILPPPEVLSPPEVLLPPEPEVVPLREVPERMEPAEPPSDLQVEKLVPKESIPSVEQPAPPVRELIFSPLDESALHSREVMAYLRETAPILEELSVLMTRAPSLAIADYDPSDPNAAVVPKEITLKMDSLKRELQILDSKTFAVIPPAKYAEYHSLIRQSIAETYQACDAILGFINETDPSNLKKADDHIFRARELIQRTRETSSHG